MSDVEFSSGGEAPAPAPAPAPAAEAPAPVSTTDSGHPDQVERAEAAKQKAEAEQSRALKEQQPDKPKPVEKKEPEQKSTRDAIKDAQAKIAEREAKEAAEAKAKVTDPPSKKPEPSNLSAEKPERVEKEQETKPEPRRDETGRFHKPDWADPPHRFSEDAKREWSTAPDSVKAEVHRATRELTDGLTRYQKAFEPLRPYAEEAMRGGTDLPTALKAYTGIERAWRENAANGFMHVCANLGVDPLMQAKAIYEALSGAVAGGQTLPRGDSPELAAVKAELNEIKSSLGQMTNERQMTTLTSQVEAFAAQPGKERFAELADEISQMIATGYAESLEDAYRKAALLIPAAAAPAPQPAASSARDPDPASQIAKGQKSVAGAPASGINPAVRPPSKSIRESIAKAMASAG